MEIHAERQEERRIRREQKVRGVDLDATKIDDPADVPLCTEDVYKRQALARTT